MRIKLTSNKPADSIAWTAVKGWLIVVLVWLTLPPLTSSMASRAGQTGLKTVLAGRIRASKITPVTLDFSARAISVEVKPGDRVKAGQLLAVLESPEVEARLQRSLRRLELASLRQRGLPLQRAAQVRAAQVRAAEQQAKETRARLAAYSTAFAEAAFARAAKDAENLARMAQQRLATAQELDSARKTLEIEKANLAQANNTVLRLQHEVRAADSHLALVRLQNDADTPGADATTQLDYEEALADVHAAQKQLQSLRLLAPHDGTILTVSVQPGAPAGGWEPLFQIADLNSLQVEVPVTARLARMIPPGSQVRIVIPSDPPESITAEVGDLQFVPEQLQHSHIVRIPLRNYAARFILIGMDCAVEFQHGGPA